MFSSILGLVVRRLFFGVPLVISIVVLTFLLIRLAPGDPATLMAGDAPTPEFLAQIRAEYGLDEPVLHQLGSYLWKVLQGDLGQSIFFSRPVADLILQHFPVTWLLVVVSMFFASVIGVLLAVMAAENRDGPIDLAVSAMSLLGFSVPTFWLGQLLVLLFAVHLGWFPATGMTSAQVDHQGLDYVLDVIRHMTLPVVTLMFFELAMIARYTRTAMIEALEKEYVVVAYAKGASRDRVLWRHALPNAMTTTVTIIGLEFGVLLAGAVVTEIIYGWSGIGRLFFDAVFRRDFPLLTGCFLFTSVVVVMVNIVTDVLVAILDPPGYAVTAVGPVRQTLQVRKQSRLSRMFGGYTLRVGLLLLIIPIGAAVFAPLLTSENPMALSIDLLLPPSLEHPMGTDDLGRDVLARVLYGGRLSLMVGLLSALIAAFIGTMIGTLAGYAGGVADDILMRGAEFFQVIPRFLLAIVVVALLGGGQGKIILIIGLLSWTGTARIIRAQLLVLRREEFVLAAIMGGASPARVVFRQILPNIAPYIIVSASLSTASAILVESFLSFLGLGDPARPSWGLLLQQAQLHLQQAWWMSIFPGIALSMTILGLNLFGDGLASKFGTKAVGK